MAFFIDPEKLQLVIVFKLECEHLPSLPCTFRRTTSTFKNGSVE